MGTNVPCSHRGLTEPSVCVRGEMGNICGRTAIICRIRLEGSIGREMVSCGAGCAMLWWALAAEKG